MFFYKYVILYRNSKKTATKLKYFRFNPSFYFTSAFKYHIFDQNGRGALGRAWVVQTRGPVFKSGHGGVRKGIRPQMLLSGPWGKMRWCDHTANRIL